MWVLQPESLWCKWTKKEKMHNMEKQQGTKGAFLRPHPVLAYAWGCWSLASERDCRPQRHPQIITVLFDRLHVSPCRINWVSFWWFVFSAPLKTWQLSLSLKAISMHVSFIFHWLVIFSVIFNIYLCLKLLPCKYYKNELRWHGAFEMIYLPQ